MPSASCVTAAVDCCRLANSVWECWTHRGVQEVRGLLIKPCESTRGVARASTAVMVTTGYFLIGLSSAEEDVQRNIQMLKERGWFDSRSSTTKSDFLGRQFPIMRGDPIGMT